MLDDLEFAAEAIRSVEMNHDTYCHEERETEWIDTFRYLVRNEERSRRSIGDSLYEAYLKMVRWSAQRALLGRGGVNIPMLSWMYGLPRGLPTGFGKDMWAQLVGESKLRLQVGELPIATTAAQTSSNEPSRLKWRHSSSAGTGSSAPLSSPLRWKLLFDPTRRRRLA
jgi:hypothetical protein